MKNHEQLIESERYSLFNGPTPVFFPREPRIVQTYALNPLHFN